MDYNTEETVVIQELFELLNREEIVIVVPRGHGDLPESVPGGDIDVIVYPDDFSQTIDMIRDIGFKPPTKRKRAKNVVTPLINNPSRAASIALNKPKNALDFVEDQMKPQKSINEEYAEWKGRYGTVIIHLMNHLAYRSPMNEAMVRVDPEVEKSLFKNRQLQNGIPIPAPPDELAHLICRGIFAKDGNFPPYYIERCDELAKAVLATPEMRDHFQELLSLLFFEADDLVFDLVSGSHYNQIKDELLRYADY